MDVHWGPACCQSAAALKRVHEQPGCALVQGMNFIAGALLLFMDEEVVFWALATIVEDLLPGYFAQDLVAAQVDQLVFKHMVRLDVRLEVRTFRNHARTTCRGLDPWSP